jgi:hypothetical protein
MKAASPAELQLWLLSLREVAAVNKRRHEDSRPPEQRRGSGGRLQRQDSRESDPVLTV